MISQYLHTTVTNIDILPLCFLGPLDVFCTPFHCHRFLYRMRLCQSHMTHFFWYFSANLFRHQMRCQSSNQTTMFLRLKITNFRWTLNGGYQHFFVALFFSGDHLAIVRSTYLFRNFFTPCVWSINLTLRCSNKCCVAFRFKPSLANYFWLWSSVTCNIASRYQLNKNT